MEMTHSHPDRGFASDSPATPVPFDVLRALISARQAASLTVRLMTAGDGADVATGGTASLIDMFARGQFSSAQGAAFFSGEPAHQQDERHA
jgi:hypothetical protein